MPALLAKFTANLLGSAALLVAFAAAAATVTRVDDVRLWSGPEGTRLVLDLSAPAKYEVFAVEHPDRIVIDLENAELAMRRDMPAGQGPVKSVRSGPQPNHGLRLVLDLDMAHDMRSFTVPPDGNAGHRLVVELPPSPASRPGAASPPVPAPAAVSPPLTESASPVKRLAAADVNGRDLVVAVDAGHGGQDPGALGRGGTREKDVTLAIARRLAAAIDAEEGMRAVLIRDGDYFITLGGRTRKARELGADMFVSIHADSVRNREVSGSSVYVLSLRGASDEAARWLAESENAADLKGGVSLDDKDDVLASVLLDVTQKESVSSSVEAADSVLAVAAPHRHRSSAAGAARGLRRAEVAGYPVDAGRDGIHLEHVRRASPARHRPAAASRRRNPQRRDATTSTTSRHPAPRSRRWRPRSAAAVARRRHSRSAERHASRHACRASPVSRMSPSGGLPAARFAILAAPARGRHADHDHPGPARATRPPDRRRRGRRAPGVRDQGTGREQPRRRRDARSRSRSRGGGAGLCRVRDDGSGIAADELAARARTPRDQQDRPHRGPRGGAHARLPRRGAAEHRVGVAHARSISRPRDAPTSRWPCPRWTAR